MPTYSLSKSFNWQGTVTDKVASVCRMFGLTTDRLTERKVSYSCQLQINDGDIIYFTGPSGAGKSVLLRELEKSVPAPDRVNLARIKLPADKTLIDCIDDDLLDSLKMLSTAGLNDCFCILNQPLNLSDGQKYRFRLAMALAAKKKFIFADEFCSELDRITAAVISYNVHKFAKRTGTIFILASSHNDILLDLSPDVLIAAELSGQAEVIYKRARK
ncbi:MAG: ABC transporter [Planctomycetes bacterium]|nr:ABC transporter [Planctomycetota bacterium]